MNKALMATLLGLSSVFWIANEYPKMVPSTPTVALTTATDNTVELGRIHWKRDLEQAKELSAESGKPLFVQFQEVPG